MLVGPVVLCGLGAALYGLAQRWGFRQSGNAAILLGVIGLAVALRLSVTGTDLGPMFAPPMAVAAFGLGWLGYKMRRIKPRRPQTDNLFAALSAPSPSKQTIRPEDVCGPWQFYVDAAACTVTIDLEIDGRYRQVIVGNCGTRTDCPGGAWRLEGPYLELTSYRSASRGETGRVRWFFGDQDGEPVLFAKDDPQAERMLMAVRHEVGVIG